MAIRETLDKLETLKRLDTEIFWVTRMRSGKYFYKQISSMILKFQKCRVYRVTTKLLSFLVFIGAIYGGLQAISFIYKTLDGPTQQEKEAYASISLGQGREYIENLFGVPVTTNSVEDDLTYSVFESKKTYFVAFYDDEKMIAFFSFLKNGDSIKLPFSLFPDELGSFQYSDISFPAQKIVIDVGNGNMGYGLYEEYHGSGRWGYYYNYVIGECSLGTPIKNDNYLFDSFTPDEAGEYDVEQFKSLANDEFPLIRDSFYPNFAGVVAYGYNIDFPVIEFYLALSDKST